MHYWAILLAFFFPAATSPVVTPKFINDPPRPSSPCNFSSYLNHDKVTSWEFQLDVPHEKCGASRDNVLGNIEMELVLMMATNSSLEFEFHPESLRTSVFSQMSTAVATLDGRPLFPSKKTAATDRYPWSGPAFIRHRQKYASWRRGDRSSLSSRSAGNFTIHPGCGDLSLKIKDVDLAKFELLHEVLHFSRRGSKKCGLKHHACRPPRLKWKIENDRYCAVGRPTYEATWHPVELPTGLYDYKSTEKCFPGLWSWLGIDRFPLPEYNHRSFSKSVYDVTFGGVRGVANFVVTYNSLLDALTGGESAVECELSFRVKRQSAAAETTDEGKERVLKNALNAAVAVSELLHANGWDTGVH